MTTAQIDAFLAQIGWTPCDDLPTQVCAQCEKPKLRGLFTPLQLKEERPKCMKCGGLVSQKAHKQYRASGPKGKFHNDDPEKRTA